jgi:hypothetical protein
VKFSRPAAYLAVSLVGRHMLAVAAVYLITVIIGPDNRPAGPTTTTTQESQ